MRNGSRRNELRPRTSSVTSPGMTLPQFDPIPSTAAHPSELIVSLPHATRSVDVEQDTQPGGSTKTEQRARVRTTGAEKLAEYNRRRGLRDGNGENSSKSKNAILAADGLRVESDTTSNNNVCPSRRRPFLARLTLNMLYAADEGEEEEFMQYRYRWGRSVLTFTLILFALLVITNVLTLHRANYKEPIAIVMFVIAAILAVVGFINQAVIVQSYRRGDIISRARAAKLYEACAVVGVTSTLAMSVLFYPFNRLCLADRAAFGGGDPSTCTDKVPSFCIAASVVFACIIPCRAIIAITIGCIVSPTALFLVRLAAPSDSGTSLLMKVFGTVVPEIIFAALAIRREQSYRNRFAMEKEIDASNARTLALRKLVDDTLETVLPRGVAVRVLARQPIIDACPLTAICVCDLAYMSTLSATADVQTFITVASTLAQRFNAAIDASGSGEKLKTTGDRMVFTVGLLRSSSSPRAAISTASQVALQLTQVTSRTANEHQISPHDLPTRVCVGVGACVGGVVGLSALSYEVQSPVLSELDEIVAECPNGIPVATDSAVLVCPDFFTADPFLTITAVSSGKAIRIFRIVPPNKEKQHIISSSSITPSTTSELHALVMSHEQVQEGAPSSPPPSLVGTGTTNSLPIEHLPSAPSFADLSTHDDEQQQLIQHRYNVILTRAIRRDLESPTGRAHEEDSSSSSTVHVDTVVGLHKLALQHVAHEALQHDDRCGAVSSAFTFDSPRHHESRSSSISLSSSTDRYFGQQIFTAVSLVFAVFQRSLGPVTLSYTSDLLEAEFTKYEAVLVREHLAVVTYSYVLIFLVVLVIGFADSPQSFGSTIGAPFLCAGLVLHVLFAVLMWRRPIMLDGFFSSRMSVTFSVLFSVISTFVGVAFSNVPLLSGNTVFLLVFNVGLIGASSTRFSHGLILGAVNSVLHGVIMSLSKSAYLSSTVVIVQCIASFLLLVYAPMEHERSIRNEFETSVLASAMRRALRDDLAVASALLEHTLPEYIVMRVLSSSIPVLEFIEDAPQLCVLSLRLDELSQCAIDSFSLVDPRAVLLAADSFMCEIDQCISQAVALVMSEEESASSYTGSFPSSSSFPTNFERNVLVKIRALGDMLTVFGPMVGRASNGDATMRAAVKASLVALERIQNLVALRSVGKNDDRGECGFIMGKGGAASSSFTGVLHVAPGIIVVLGTSLNVMGMATRQADALLRACPQGYVGATGAFVNAVSSHRLKLPAAKECQTVLSESSENWRVRGAGSIAMHKLLRAPLQQ